MKNNEVESVEVAQKSGYVNPSSSEIVPFSTRLLIVISVLLALGLLLCCLGELGVVIALFGPAGIFGFLVSREHVGQIPIMAILGWLMYLGFGLLFVCCGNRQTLKGSAIVFGIMVLWDIMGFIYLVAHV